jgi:hypothetical protein
MASINPTYRPDDALGFFLAASFGVAAFFFVSLWVSPLSTLCVTIAAVVLAFAVVAATVLFARSRIHRRRRSYLLLAAFCALYANFILYANFTALNAAKDFASIAVKEMEAFRGEQARLPNSLLDLGKPRAIALLDRLSEWRHPILRFQPSSQIVSDQLEVLLGTVGRFSVLFAGSAAYDLPTIAISGRERQWIWQWEERRWESAID